MMTDGAALNRWRLVLGKNADQQLSLSDSRMRRMDDALDFLYSRESGEDVRERNPQGGHGERFRSWSHWHPYRILSLSRWLCRSRLR